jgi:hypothetical protein
VDFNAGEQGLKPVQARDKPGIGDGRLGLNRQDADDIQVLNGPDFVLKIQQRPPDHPVQALTGVGKGDLPRQTVKQRKSQVFFQAPYLVTDSPLGDVEFLRGFGDAHISGYRDKGRQSGKDDAEIAQVMHEPYSWIVQFFCCALRLLYSITRCRARGPAQEHVRRMIILEIFLKKT